ncbi:hypothetical protein NIES37_30650 [Tolypothrix tenuis PCC 7101]|uniref:Uncharacterized protein n=1 Tax=Tolypothrix tenuis PCC 7101 TaxID=231146 RepID=A0A1Z4N017_9CYAN|nr:hypothetical protein NIES37_30650 [Tolypothrix tenuis PCC 7101]BAZ76991.1 hypothetical protein NIES50_55930 [Aulosira laxa NIES-50]
MTVAKQGFPLEVTLRPILSRTGLFCHLLVTSLKERVFLRIMLTYLNVYQNGDVVMLKKTPEQLKTRMVRIIL